MKRVFADTFYWIALINKSDSWYQRVKSYSVNLENIEIITTEEVLRDFSSCLKIKSQLMYEFMNSDIADTTISPSSKTHPTPQTDEQV